MKFVTNGSVMAPLPIVIQPASDLPLAFQLKQQITWLVATNVIKPGEKLPPIRVLAAQVGVHYQTVRAVYHQLSEDGLVAIRQGSGATVLPFSGLQLARPETSVHAKMVGVLIAGMDPFYLPFLQGVEEVAEALPSLVVICNAEDNPVKAKLQINQLILRGMDGIIAASVGNLVQRELGFPQTGGPFPIVYCDQPDTSGHVILFDAENAGYQAVKHLLDHGHRRIGIVTAPIDWPNMSECFAGYRRALMEAGIAPRQSLVSVTKGFSISQGSDAARSLLVGSNPPTAMFATADILAIGAQRAIKSEGLRVPEDVAMIGYNDIEIASMVEPALTSLAAPAYEMGRLAMGLLARLIAGERVNPTITRLETSLVIRRSCGCYPPGEGDHH
ncbi:MAG TPA: substrate-binding domain-containing protein [Anaerolineales bacterium]